jgi:hypothetical protein
MHHRIVVPVVALGLALVVAGGCSRATQTESDEVEPVNRADVVVTVRVVNHSQLDATIYPVHDGARDRLGTVTAASTSAFAVRGRSLASGDFTLVADPVGARRASSTERLNVLQGMEFIWTIEADFSRSSVLVRG